MFVRFRPSLRRLQLSLVETRREGGKVRHEHVASLGAIPTPLTVAGRVEFWQRLHQRLGRLLNRLDGEMQTKILDAVHARVPMPTVDEIHALNLEEAKQHEMAWRISIPQAFVPLAISPISRAAANQLIIIICLLAFSSEISISQFVETGCNTRNVRKILAERAFFAHLCRQ
jgi:hypothetical protein